MALQDITGLLAAWNDGNDDALNQLIPLVYPELRRIARLHFPPCVTIPRGMT